MAEKVSFEIITPQRVVFEDEADCVILPGNMGEFGVQPGHMPLVSLLHPGELRYNSGLKTNRLAVSSGFVEVFGDRVSVLVDSAEKKEDIEVDRARASMERAKERLKNKQAEDIDFARAEMALKRAVARLKVAERS
jgi:F-type H+-transporting ATPase subunit epsilon